ncbi:tryptophan halogenase family protein [Shewanella halotolerans]|uniref:tryptophan halogenase family protein n=1 Tax=Shewanella halotolerans TaxID=2864204 RepID=UPI001C656BC2|nr:tryptophan halogenase family protein [Shewanella halotolerans]QYJ91541.1 tryptophan 7-halogenase [Shewanella halotolerans]
MSILSIAIVGGGASGWLAANHLGLALKGRSPKVSITLIESPDVPTIGVGEGTVPMIRKSLQAFGIEETALFRRCDASFKQSIKFINWRHRTPGSEMSDFHHLFDPPSPFGVDLSDFWLDGLAKGENPMGFDEALSPQSFSCEAQKAPKTLASAPYQGAHAYAYHFDAAKFAELLRENAMERFGVEHIQDHLLEVETGRLRTDSVETDMLTEGNESKNDKKIVALHLREGGRRCFDFYLDCSGFSGLLMEKALGVEFISLADKLWMNKALVTQVASAPDAPLPPYTQASAHQAGWIWDIALPKRRGVGLVYCDRYLSDDEARQKLKRYLGDELLSAGEFRSLTMRVGHLQKFWQGNCVALGLAQGFLEPLEATSILLTDFAASLLARKFPTDSETLPVLEARFNRIVGHAWQAVIDFVALHYQLSDRSDSAFWRDYRTHLSAQPTSEELPRRLALWQHFTPHPDDFFSQFEVFGVDNYLYLLYGMGFSTQPKALDDAARQQARAQLDKIAHAKAFLAQKLPDHRAFIRALIQG